IEFFNQQSDLFRVAKVNNQSLSVEDFVDADSNKISWNRNLKQDIEAGKKHQFISSGIVTAHVRPFVKSKLYFDKDMNAMLYQNKKLFPTPSHRNMAICVSGVGASKEFSTLITDCISDLQMQFNG